MTSRDYKLLESFLDDLRHVSGFGGLPCPVSIDSKTPLGTTPLHVACIRGDVDAVRVLLFAGAEVNAVGEDGYTPLHEAVAQGKWKVLPLLLQAGADLNIRNEDGLTSLELLKVSHGMNDFPKC